MKPYDFLVHLNEAQPEYIADAAPKKNRSSTAAGSMTEEVTEKPVRSITMTGSRMLMWSARAAVVALAVGIGAIGLNAVRTSRRLPAGSTANESSLAVIIPAESETGTEHPEPFTTAADPQSTEPFRTDADGISIQTAQTAATTVNTEASQTDAAPVSAAAKPADVLAYLGIEGNELVRGETAALQGVSSVAAWVYEESLPERGIANFEYQGSTTLSFYLDDAGNLRGFSGISCRKDSGGIFAGDRTYTEEELKARAADMMQHLLPDYSSYLDVTYERTPSPETAPTLALRRIVPRTLYSMQASIRLNPDGSIKELDLPDQLVPEPFDSAAFDEAQETLLQAYTDRFRELHPDCTFSIQPIEAGNYDYCGSDGIRLVKCRLARSEKTLQLTFAFIPGYHISAEKLDREIAEQWTVFETAPFGS